MWVSPGAAFLARVCGFAERVSCSPTLTGITTTFHGKTVSIGPSYEKRGTDSRGKAGILTSMPLMLGLSCGLRVGFA